MIKHPNTFEEYNNLINSGCVLVDFYATWCGPCKMIAPILEELDRTNGLGDVTIVKVDVDDLPMVAAQYGITSIPTLIYFEYGKALKKTLGYQNKEKIISFVAK
jgi:thioredoxin 1